jgi:hypothetical protein
MRKHKGDSLYFMLVFLAFMAGARMFFLDTMLDSDLLKRSLQSFAKKFFLYKDFVLKNRISAKDLMFCFTAYLFMGFHLNCSLYGTTRKYRSMIMLRYGSRTRYFHHNCKVIVLRSFMITAGSIGCFLLASWLNRIPFNFSESEVSSSILLMINLFLFLNLLGFINIYCVMNYKDTTALIITSVFTSVLLLADVSEPFLSVITYGNVWMELKGMILLALCIITSYFVSGKVLKKNGV